MLQGPAAYFSSPVYGQSHYKKFWLKKMETEDDPEPDGGGVVLKNRPPYAVNCSPMELRGTSPPPAAVKSAERSAKRAHDSELDYALALGVGVSMQEEGEAAESWDGLDGGDHKFVAPAPPSSCAGVNGTCNVRSPSPSPRGGALTRMCADCKTIKTPLWRNGPQGPKSLCNACGIRYKKLGKRPLTNGGERPSPPPTPPISPSGKSVTKHNGKRKRETDGVRATKAAHKDERHRRKKTKALRGLERFRSAGGALQSNSSTPLDVESPELRSDGCYYGCSGGGDRSEAAWRRRREVERIRKGLVRYGKMRSMPKDEEEAAVLLMAMSCGVPSCC